MAWRVEFLEGAARTLAKLDKSVQARIVRFARERLQGDDDPSRMGKPLRGNHAGRRRYRVGDCWPICNVEDSRLPVLVIEIGHRREVCRD